MAAVAIALLAFVADGPGLAHTLLPRRAVAEAAQPDAPVPSESAAPPARPLASPRLDLLPAVLYPSRGPFVAPPPMGWNGYNHFKTAVTAGIVEAEAQALVASGMRSAGYDYVNLDGGWDLGYRSRTGELLADPSKFPAGMAPVAAFVHGLGLKFGIYTSAGSENCAGTSAGSFGHYQQDAATFAAWGVDYLKLDWCYVPYSSYPTLQHWQVSRLLAGQMGAALRATGRPIEFDVNDYWTSEQPWTWAPGAGALLCRVTPDIHDTFASLLTNFQHDVSLSWRARRGVFDDPDMLEVGNGGMTATEYRAMFSLWAELAAPLIAGNDLAQMSAATRSILLDRAVIAVDQDRLGVQGYAVANPQGYWVLTRPLADGSRVVVLFNQTAWPARITTSLGAIGFGAPAIYRLTDLWTGAVSYTSDAIAAEVPGGGAVMIRIS